MVLNEHTSFEDTGDRNLTAQDSRGFCPMCGRISGLQLSHIIPAFVVKRVVQSAPSKSLRHFNAVDRPLQGVERARLLCSPCEERISAWERRFCLEMYVPFHEQNRQTFVDSGWLLNFVIATTWRTLVHHMTRLVARNQAVPDYVQEAAGVWRDYLVGVRSDPGMYDHHMAHLGITDVDGKVAIGHHLGLSFTTGFGLICMLDAATAIENEEAFVYVNLGGILVVSCIRPRTRTGWVNTRVGEQRNIRMQDQAIPASFRSWLVAREARATATLLSMSLEQREKMTRRIAENVLAAIKSDSPEGKAALAAMQAREASRRERSS
jgi:hypothetical protein